MCTYHPLDPNLNRPNLQVVDGIASPRNTVQIDDAHIASRDEHDASTDYGMTEGMTLLLLDTAKAAPDLWSSPNQHEEADRHEVGHLSFVTKDTSHRSSNVNVKELPKKAVTRIFKIPLANTVFQSGQVSTLFAQRMKLNGMPGKSVGPTLEKYRSLQHQTLELEDLLTAPTSSGLSTQLTRITHPRVVDAAVGNILKTFRRDTGIQQPFPASQELESAVSRWRTQSSIDGQRPGVWALVIPREAIQGPEFLDSRDILSSIDTGARLHHVLSGGGGWGNKKGLLSLDPVCKPEIFESDSSVPPWMRETEDGFGFETFEQTVKPGDIVTFFIAQLQPLQSPLSRPELRGTSLALGTCLPVDDTPSSDGERDSNASCVVTANHFGVLSSKGIEFTVANRDGKAKSEDTSQSSKLVTKTILDAPHTVYHQWSIAGGPG